MSQLAPISLFCYRREDLLARTVAALRANELANDSSLWVFSDGARDRTDLEDVKKVREFVDSISGFRSIHRVYSDVNLGLANSIQSGVGQLIRKFGRIIVLEDDIVTAPLFLKYMNRALDEYENSPKVWHVNGFSFPVPHSTDSCFMTRIMNCWGWGTWADRWANYRRDPERLLSSWTRTQIRYLNVDDSINYWEQVVRNAYGTLNTWAVFWHTTICEEDGLCLMPPRSFVQNIGFNGTGENAGVFSGFDHPSLCDNIPMFPMGAVEDQIAIRNIKKYFKGLRPNYRSRVIKRILKLLTGFNRSRCQG